METGPQPSLFDKSAPVAAIEEVILHALGDFQSRGHELANRELALDRLQGAFARASQKFGIAELSDEIVVQVLSDLGASITVLPRFVAKRPYRVVLNDDLCRRATEEWHSKNV